MRKPGLSDRQFLLTHLIPSIFSLPMMQNVPAPSAVALEAMLNEYLSQPGITIPAGLRSVAPRSTSGHGWEMNEREKTKTNRSRGKNSQELSLPLLQHDISDLS